MRKYVSDWHENIYDNLQVILDVYEQWDVDSPILGEIREKLDKADTLIAYQNQAGSLGSPAAKAADKLAEDPGTLAQAVELVTVAAMQSSTDTHEERANIIDRAIMKAIGSAWNILSTNIDEFWSTLDAQIVQVVQEAASIEIPQGMVTFEQAFILGVPEEWGALQGLYAKWADLHAVAGIIRTGELVGKYNFRRDNIADIRWKDDAAVSRLSGQEEAPGEWLHRAALTSEPWLPTVDEIRVHTDHDELELLNNYPTRKQWEQHQAEQNWQQQQVEQEWLACKADIAARVAAKHVVPARVARDVRM